MPLLDASALQQESDQLTSLFRLLSDKTRLTILLALTRGEQNVGSLCEELRLPQPTVSHHLGLLRANNMISSRRRGKRVFYALDGAVKLVDGNGLEVAAANFSLKITRRPVTSRSVPSHPGKIALSRE